MESPRAISDLLPNRAFLPCPKGSDDRHHRPVQFDLENKTRRGGSNRATQLRYATPTASSRTVGFLRLRPITHSAGRAPRVYCSRPMRMMLT